MKGVSLGVYSRYYASTFVKRWYNRAINRLMQHYDFASLVGQCLGVFGSFTIDPGYLGRELWDGAHLGAPVGVGQHYYQADSYPAHLAI